MTMQEAVLLNRGEDQQAEAKYEGEFIPPATQFVNSTFKIFDDARGYSNKRSYRI